MDGNTEAELLLLAPGMLVSEAAPGLKPWLNREDQIFQPHPGEPSEPAQPGLMWTNKGLEEFWGPHFQIIFHKGQGSKNGPLRELNWPAEPRPDVEADQNHKPVNRPLV